MGVLGDAYVPLDCSSGRDSCFLTPWCTRRRNGPGRGPRAVAEGLIPWVEEKAPELGTADGRRSFTLEFGERMTEAVAVEIDRIEEELMQLHPEFGHIDFESD